MVAVRMSIITCLFACLPTLCLAGPVAWELGGIYTAHSSSGFIGNWSQGVGASLGAMYQISPRVDLILHSSYLRYPYKGGNVEGVSIPECRENWSGSTSSGVAFGAEVRLIEPGTHKRFRGFLSFQFDVQRFDFGRVMINWSCIYGDPSHGTRVHSESDQATIYGLLSLGLGQSIRLWSDKRIVIQSGFGVDDRLSRVQLPVSVSLQFGG